jgi:hypothetical protein
VLSHEKCHIATNLSSRPKLVEYFAGNEQNSTRKRKDFGQFTFSSLRHFEACDIEAEARASEFHPGQA